MRLKTRFTLGVRTLDLPEIEEGQEDTTDWKAEAQKLREKAIAQRERTKTLKQQLADAKKAVEVVAGSNKTSTQPKTGELDETQLDYLDLKGISDQDQIDLIQKVMKNSGQTLRQTLRDDYVLARLETIKKEKEVKDATPSSTKRGGSGTNDVATALARYEQSGFKDLPEDFALRSAVVNAMAEKTNSNKPAWMK